MVTVQADFYGDWIEMLRGRLAAVGHVPDKTASNEDIAFSYFNLQNRLIPSRARRVEVSRELACPALLTAALSAVRQKVEMGGDLTPHLSLSVARDAEFNDGLLNDWGIHHLHLGTVPHPQVSGFVNRTGPVLFARFELEVAYFIQIAEHGNCSDREMLEILHRNWPTVTARTRLNGVASVPHATSEEMPCACPG